MLNKPLAVRRDYSGSCNHVKQKIGKTWRRIKTTTKPGISVSSAKNGRNEIFGRSDQPLAREESPASLSKNAEFVTSCISNGRNRRKRLERESANLIDLFTLWSRIKKEILTKSSAEVHRLRNENFGTC